MVMSLEYLFSTLVVHQINQGGVWLCFDFPYQPPSCTSDQLNPTSRGGPQQYF